MNIDQRIEEKRSHLIQLAKDHLLSDPLVIKASQDLDKLIYAYQEQKRG
ncbi:aspartyl-phosphate phosphatase Spo0E family protein [Cytobacillus gottheilii]|nr:aspartyl-phosphate phosphatase Spo0E family protein [Cytobacillus gottheilii]